MSVKDVDLWSIPEESVEPKSKLPSDEDSYKSEFQSWVVQFDPDYRPYRWGYVGPGWKPLLEKCFADLKQAGWVGKILQIKEKFGSLRLYVTGHTAEMSEIISHYEEASRTTCEECGEPGTQTKTNWIRTLCPIHSGEAL